MIAEVVECLVVFFRLIGLMRGLFLSANETEISMGIAISEV